MILSNKSFNGKILLFGEYSIIKGSKALSIPYNKVNGKLKFSELKNEAEIESNINIRKLFNFIGKNDFRTYFNLHKFSSFLDNGLYFDSNIPQGYGVGSSGSLVAALYYEFKSIIELSDFKELQTLFGNIESFFHGKSSGLDPLISYTNKSLLIDEEKNINILENFDFFSINLFELELIDSFSTGKTEPLVNLFLEKCKNEDYLNNFNNLIKFNNCAIDALLNNNFTAFKEYLNKISEFEFENLKEMIVKKIIPIWEQTVSNPNQIIKLCGSGGGGFYQSYKFNY